MTLQTLPHDFTVCKLASLNGLDLNQKFFFIGRTDEEISLVCITEDTPPETVAREDGWKAFRIQGTLDFSLIGILAKLCDILARNRIGIFAVSTYNTDYILLKKENYDRAIRILAESGYSIA